MERPKETADIVEKEFLAFPDVAADTLNALLYEGREVVEESRLMPGMTETVYQGEKGLRRQIEDLGKYVLADGHVKVMYLIANQSRTDGRMLLRKAGYTGGVYREQYGGKHRDRFPVIEVVLYWGHARWRGSRDLRHFFRGNGLTEEWKYIDEIRLHVFEMRHLPQEMRERLRSDMRIVADFLAGEELSCSRQKIVHKAALVKMLYVLSGDNNVEDIEETLREMEIREEDEVAVCELFDQYYRKGEKHGMELGEKRGEQRGKKLGDAKRLVECIENVVKNFHVTLEKACESLNVTISQYEEARRLI